MAACFEDIVETDEVALDVAARVGDGVSDTGLCCKVDDNGWFVCGEEVVDTCLVGYIAFDEYPVATECFDLFESCVLDIHVVIVCDGVDADYTYVLKVLEHSFYEVGTYETGCAGDEDGFIFEGNVVG